MKEALKVILLFKKPTWDDYRLPYIFFGIIGWSLIISIVIEMIK
jgi:preprotein translocase subunit Sss1